MNQRFPELHPCSNLQQQRLTKEFEKRLDHSGRSEGESYEIRVSQKQNSESFILKEFVLKEGGFSKPPI
jgi:hypothetical protein